MASGATALRAALSLESWRGWVRPTTRFSTWARNRLAFTLAGPGSLADDYQDCVEQTA